MIRFLLGHSLSVRLLWLTIVVVLMVEVLAFVPAMGRARHDWLVQHVRSGQIAILTAAAVPGGEIDPGLRDTLLSLCGAVSVRLDVPGQPSLVLRSGAVGAAVPVENLRRETALEEMRRALGALVHQGGGLLRVEAASPLAPEATIEIVFNQNTLDADLRAVADDIGTVSVLVALTAGVLMYLALHALLVRPMHRIIGSIVAFRTDPERANPIDPEAVAPLANDEIAAASRELAALQRELRGALWRNARLAALGAAMSRTSHDLRGILSPALLAAERLQTHDDPKVSHAGEVLVRAVEGATDLIRRTVEFAREGPPALRRAPLELSRVVEEAIEQVHATAPGLHIESEIPPATRVDGDAGELVRVFANLLRNAGEAGAGHVVVSAIAIGGEIAVTVSDDGPGLPAAVREALFHPFVTGGRRGGSGLGLAIAHDLVRAHGGDLVLLQSGAAGTSFRLTLPRDTGADGKPA
jgi:signal transduction histidine kinase